MKSQLRHCTTILLKKVSLICITDFEDHGWYAGGNQFTVYGNQYFYCLAENEPLRC